MPRAVLGVGGNLGARRAFLRAARALLDAQPGLRVLGVSPIYHTAPLGPPQPDYLNAALLVDWVGSAHALLRVTQHVEALLLRQRGEHWGARTLDLDLLHWSEGAIFERDLVVPHPELTRRLFALVPLLDVAPELAAVLAVSLSDAERHFAVSEPFTPAIRRDGESFVADLAPEEPLEWLCGFVEALAVCSAPARAAKTLPFVFPLSGSSPEALTASLSTLAQRVASSQKHGFLPQKAAILHVGEGGCTGVLVGELGGRQQGVGTPCWTLESGAAGLRFRVSCS